MKIRAAFLGMLALCLVLSAHVANAELARRAADPAAIRADLALILRQAGLPPETIQLRYTDPRVPGDAHDLVRVSCPEPGRFILDVQSDAPEWSSATYHALLRMGFLFPHPRMQISPTLDSLRGSCGQEYVWLPRLKYRGSHLHTMHPSEWVEGFLAGDTEIAVDTVRWHARNGQNVLQFMPLIGMPLDKRYKRALKPATDLAHQLGIQIGIDVSFELRQQYSYRLIPESGSDPITSINREWARLSMYIDFDFATIELGANEFSAGSGTQETVRWIEHSRKVLAKDGKWIFLKAHVSMPKQNPEDNFNFLARQCHPDVGVLPHTVMFYGFGDEHTPVYGRTTFADIWEMLKQENKARPTWYYPETSYFIAMDIDVPLFLTDYLRARSIDMDMIEAEHVPGQLNFTTGHELGYWLMDWTVALLNHRGFAGDPLIALRLLGEDMTVWKQILDFQTKHFKERGLLSMLSSATYLDEMPPPIKQEVHTRNTFEELRKRPEVVTEELERLSAAMAELPPTSGIRHPELRKLVEITHLRVTHAYHLRYALLAGEGNSSLRQERLQAATWVREAGLALMREIKSQYDRYPSARLFDRREDFTSYDWGYAWTAATLHYWWREEQMVKKWKFSPFFENIYDIFEIVH